MQKNKAWVVSVDMGYGHQRAAYPLRDIAYEKIITANSDSMISPEERELWEKTRKLYEFVSRVKKIPVVGHKLHKLYDDMTQSISPFFPFRDLSKPVMGVYMLKNAIKKGLCTSLIEYIKKKDLPLVATHPIPAIAAYYHGVKDIYCIVTDTDINRAWVPEDPAKSNIKYLSPSVHASVRLREYGVNEDNIIFTGFPLPKEAIGNKESILKKDLRRRLAILDPNRTFISANEKLLKSKLGVQIPKKVSRQLTLSYMVGGAGAQADIGVKILRSLRLKLLQRKININLVVGIRIDVLNYYTQKIVEMGMKDEIGKSIHLIFDVSKKKYFQKFNDSLHDTDIIWTKPSEMSFYTALGIPIIISPPIGSHEEYNKEWLQHMASGFVQENPDFVEDWLFYWIENGRLAEAAWDGWVKAPTLGTYKIEEIIEKR